MVVHEINNINQWMNFNKFDAAAINFNIMDDEKYTFDPRKFPKLIYLSLSPCNFEMVDVKLELVGLSLIDSMWDSDISSIEADNIYLYFSEGYEIDQALANRIILKYPNAEYNVPSKHLKYFPGFDFNMDN